MFRNKYLRLSILAFILCLCNSSSAQVIFKGQLHDQELRPQAGVFVKGLAKTTETDENGYFHFDFPELYRFKSIYIEFGLKQNQTLVGQASNQTKIDLVGDPTLIIKFTVKDKEIHLNALHDEIKSLHSGIKQVRDSLSKYQSIVVETSRRFDEYIENQETKAELEALRLNKNYKELAEYINKEIDKNSGTKIGENRNYKEISLAHAVLADSYMLDHDFIKAKIEYEVALSYDPVNWKLRMALGIAQNLSGDKQSGLKTLESLSEESDIKTFLKYASITDHYLTNISIDSASISINTALNSLLKVNMVKVDASVREYIALFTMALASSFNDLNEPNIAFILYEEASSQLKNLVRESKDYDLLNYSARLHAEYSLLCYENGLGDKSVSLVSYAVEVARFLYDSAPDEYNLTLIEALNAQSKITQLKSGDASYKSIILEIHELLENAIIDDPEWIEAKINFMLTQIILTGTNENYDQALTQWNNVIQLLENPSLVNDRYVDLLYPKIYSIGAILSLDAGDFKTATFYYSKSLSQYDSIQNNTSIDVRLNRAILLSSILKNTDKIMLELEENEVFEKIISDLNAIALEKQSYKNARRLHLALETLSWTKYVVTRPTVSKKVLLTNLKVLESFNLYHELSYLRFKLNCYNGLLLANKFINEVFPSKDIIIESQNILNKVQNDIIRFQELGGEMYVVQTFKDHQNQFDKAYKHPLSINESLVTACELNLPDLVEKAISEGADVNFGDDWKPIQLACVNGSYPVFQILINNSSRTDFRTSEGQTLLHLASASGNIDIVSRLITLGLDPNATGEVIYDVKKPSLPGEEVNSEVVQDFDVTPLMLAGQSKSKSFEVTRFLVEHGANIDALSLKGESVFYFHIANSAEESSIYLLDKGLRLNEEDFPRFIITAISNNMNQLLQKLTNQEGFDVGFKIDNGMNYLDVALATGNLDAAEIFLKSGVSLNAIDKDFGYSSLHLAVLLIDGNAIKWLINKGADINIQSDENGTPLGLANMLPNGIEIIPLLLENGADIDITDKNGNTPLMVAAFKRNSKAVKLLIESGANKNIQNSKGMTPLKWAELIKDQTLIRLLSTD
ncbi:MAG: ankyrin repeat domain-containing protein [Cytophagales bacterium]|nr:ankyrin repeat domain-containing protein [Cytophagales bacterium]